MALVGTETQEELQYNNKDKGQTDVAAGMRPNNHN